MVNINIGRRYKGKRKVQYPWNKGVGDVAQQRLDQVVGQANERHEEALRVDGMQLYIWTREMAGAFCTCQGEQDKQEHFRFRSDDLSEKDEPQDTASPEDDQHDFDIFRVRGDPDVTSNQASEHRNSLEKYHKKRYDKDNEARDEDPALTDDQALDEFINNIDDHTTPEERALLEQGTGVNLFGGDKTKCGICFGTGRVNGYQFASGKRYVLDASGEIDFHLNGFELDRDERPFKFFADRAQGVWVSWTLQVPTYFENVLSVQVRNNDKPALGAIVEAKINGGNWETLTKEKLNQQEGTPTELEVRVRPELFDTEEAFEFTHVEIYYQMIELPYGQMPNLNRATNFEFFEALMNQSMEISATVPNLDREAVVIENRHGLAWKITDAQKMSTQKNQVFNWNVQVRLVQEYEVLYLLNVVRDIPVEINYQDLEKVQGQGIVDN